MLVSPWYYVLMKRIDAKTRVLKALVSLNVKPLPEGLLDHLTDQVLLSTDPEALACEFDTVARVPHGKPARLVRKLVKITCASPIPRSKAIPESIG